MGSAPKLTINNFLNKNSQPKTPAPEFPVKMISVYDLIPHPKNFYKISDIEKLEAEIEMQGGIRQNLEVKDAGGGKYMVIAGHRRRQAILNLVADKVDGISDKVPCIVKTYANEDEELKALSLSNRSQRKKTATEELEEYQVLKPILQKEFEEKKARGEVSGRFRAYMAKFLGISETSVQRIESRAKLDDEIKQKLDAGEITPTAAAELSSLSAADQRAVYEKVDKPTVKAVKERKKEVVQRQEESKPEEMPEAPEHDVMRRVRAAEWYMGKLEQIISQCADEAKRADDRNDETLRAVIADRTEYLGEQLLSVQKGLFNMTGNDMFRGD